MLMDQGVRRQIVAALLKQKRHDLARVVAQEQVANPLALTDERIKTAKRLMPKVEKLLKSAGKLTEEASKADAHFNDLMVLRKLEEAAERALRKIRATSQGKLSNLNVY